MMFQHPVISDHNIKLHILFASVHDHTCLHLHKFDGGCVSSREPLREQQINCGIVTFSLWRDIRGANSCSCRNSGEKFIEVISDACEWQCSVIRTPCRLFCSVMGRRRPLIFCDPVRHVRGTLWLLFLQTSAVTPANTHTYTLIPLNRCFRPNLGTLYKEMWLLWDTESTYLKWSNEKKRRKWLILEI